MLKRSKKVIHFIVNPISGGGKGRVVVEEIKNIFSDYIIQIKITTKKNDGYQFTLQSIEEGANLVVSCGGDGTLNEVASALINKNIPLGIVPIGSGNGLARHLKIPLEYTKALKLILTSENQIELIDVGAVNDLYFFSNAGIGFDAETIRIYSNQKRRKLLGYIKSVFISLFKFKPVNISFQHSGNNYSQKIMMFNIANSNCMGYNFSVAPQASLQDGSLNINLVEKCSWIYFSWIGMGFLLNKNLGKKRKQIQIKKLSLETNANFIQMDGECISLTTPSLDIRIIPKSLPILIG